MRYWIGVTDNRWFGHVAETRPDEVKFWQPSGTPPFVSAPIGMPFLFKLKRPHNHVAGGGHFVTYSKLPIDLAWEVFGTKNGCESLDALKQLIEPLATKNVALREIGCTVLANPFFFEQKMWIPVDANWSNSIVRGKMFDTNEVAGAAIWRNVTDRLPQTRRERDWGKFHTPRNLCAALCVEAAELLDHFRWALDGEDAPLTRASESEIVLEIADVAIVLSYLCHDLDIDLDEAVRRKIQVNREKYPVEKSKGHARKHNRL
ncbi:MAG: nucleotide pyrophosphohydrolase [Casimicrobiaceae bacterium]